MRKLFLALVAIAPASISLAQQTRTEVTKATTPHDDAKPNSPAVPDVYAIPGHFERVLVLRFKYQTDLLAGLERMVKEHKVRNAVILAGAGSVRNYHDTRIGGNSSTQDRTEPEDQARGLEVNRGPDEAEQLEDSEDLNMVEDDEPPGSAPTPETPEPQSGDRQEQVEPRGPNPRPVADPGEDPDPTAPPQPAI